jgi:DtxR family Mn-dependent transcriptional regulator
MRSSDKPFELTASLEDYLEAIKELIDADAHGHAHTSEIARRLGVKMPSVTNALGVLCKNGYIHYDASYPVTLTKRGAQAAARVMRRHAVLKSFLTDILLLEEEAASATACRVEHVIDDQLIDRLEAVNAALTQSECSSHVRDCLQQALQHLD